MQVPESVPSSAASSASDHRPAAARRVSAEQPVTESAVGESTAGESTAAEQSDHSAVTAQNAPSSESDPVPGGVATPPTAQKVFGDRLALAEQFVGMLAEHGVTRGLIGPREVDRLWDRHVLNSAVLAELLPPNSAVLDVGSGAGFPGIPLAIARPDLTLTLLEPMARRVAWLEEVIAVLGLDVTVVRGRAEEPAVRRTLTGQDVVTARAVAPLARLAGWTLPLVRVGGRLLALKGASAAEELDRDAADIAAAGGVDPEVVACGAAVLDDPVTIVAITRSDAIPSRSRTRSKSGRSKASGKLTSSGRTGAVSRETRGSTQGRGATTGGGRKSGSQSSGDTGGSTKSALENTENTENTPRRNRQSSEPAGGRGGGRHDRKDQ